MAFRMAWLTAFYVLAARLLVQVTGGMVTSTLALLLSCRHTGKTVPSEWFYLYLLYLLTCLMPSTVAVL